MTVSPSRTAPPAGPGGTARPSPRSRAAAWWASAVIYHVYLPSFRDGDGDGIGDLDGLIAGLPYLDGVLGVDALWVSPFFVSPWVDGGYDIADHEAIDPRFGDLAMFDRLIAEAHRRNLRVIVDYVPNHTSDRHPWFMESRSGRGAAKRDWYLWADGAPGGGPPNNWLSEAGGSVWERDEPTDQFFLHSHLVEQPDLNWRNPDVRVAMHAVLRFWLERGVDGFRIDVAHMLMKDPQLADNPLDPSAIQNPYDRQHPDFHTQRHVNDRRHPDLHAVLRELRRILADYGDAVAIGELDVMPWPEWAAYFGADLDELHLPMNFSLIETPWSPRAIKTALAELERHLPPGAWPVQNLGNHDRSRIASRYGAGGARLAAMLLLTVRGTPILYYGDELGMTDVDIPPELLRDGYGRAGGPTRDPNRTPLAWTDAPLGGFSPPGAAAPWLPQAPDWREQTIQGQLEHPDSILALYRALLDLRRSRPALRTGGIEILDPESPDLLVYERRLDGERLLVALNFAAEPRRLTLPAPAVRCLLSTTGEAGRGDEQEIVLRSEEGMVLELVADTRRPSGKGSP